MEKPLILVEGEFKEAMADLINSYTDKLTANQILYSLEDFVKQMNTISEQQYAMVKSEWENRVEANMEEVEDGNENNRT